MLWYMYNVMYWYSDAADDKQNTDAQADLSFDQCHNFFDFIKIKIAYLLFRISNLYFFFLN